MLWLWLFGLLWFVVVVVVVVVVVMIKVVPSMDLCAVTSVMITIRSHSIYGA